jgi:hypothetical protein
VGTLVAELVVLKILECFVRHRGRVRLATFEGEENSITNVLLLSNVSENLIELVRWSKNTVSTSSRTEWVGCWTASSENKRSLRELAERSSQQSLPVTMAEPGIQILDGEIAITYRLLTTSEIGEPHQPQTNRRLEQNEHRCGGVLQRFELYAGRTSDSGSVYQETSITSP